MGVSGPASGPVSSGEALDDDGRVDPEHSEGEERYLKLGYSTRQRLLVISYTERQERTHIIRARQATRTERRIYEEG